jgi:hypothetical protein
LCRRRPGLHPTGPLLAKELQAVDVQYVWRFLREHKIDLSGLPELPHYTYGAGVQYDFGGRAHAVLVISLSYETLIYHETLARDGYPETTTYAAPLVGNFGRDHVGSHRCKDTFALEMRASPLALNTARN